MTVACEYFAGSYLRFYRFRQHSEFLRGNRAMDHVAARPRSCREIALVIGCETEMAQTAGIGHGLAACLNLDSGKLLYVGRSRILSDTGDAPAAGKQKQRKSTNN